MRDSDYDLFLTKAICRPVKNAEHNYYLDKENHRLKCILTEAGNSDGNWIELPRLSTQAKIDFVIDFAQNDVFKTAILEIVDKMDDSSVFKIENQLKKVDFDLALRYSFRSIQFLWDSIEEIYEPYYLSPDMKVDFLYNH